jgi:prepilin-type N-terminal cleavage/methylation domain-containing protein
MTAHTSVPFPARRRRRAFTLLELLVAMGVIAILATLLLPALSRARHQARDANCKNNLSQMWKALMLYVGSPERIPLPPNHFPALRISNVLYKEQRVSGFGYTIPNYLEDYRESLFCPDDPVRGPQWAYGWENWHTESGEVQCSYGYRGRQGLVENEDTALALAIVDTNPLKVLLADYYETFTPIPRVHHDHHINVLRCNGSVDQVNRPQGHVSFGPDPEDFEQALEALDR